tara:strand:+ start:745 stop:1008 length:264 start_codon:yes stop_codon:yes gene_type:complete
MRNYIYKIIIAVIALIIVFEFTIGKTLNKITSQTDSFFTREGRKEMVGSIKDEMQKAIKKENYLKQEDRILINNFINKIRDELKNVE